MPIQTISNLVACECEHAGHTDRDSFKTPNGNYGHKYGRKFVSQFICSVQTPHGIYNVCKDCAADCMAHYEVK